MTEEGGGLRIWLLGHILYWSLGVLNWGSIAHRSGGVSGCRIGCNWGRSRGCILNRGGYC